MRIGSAGQRHIRVSGLEEEIELVAERDAGKLRVRSRQGVLIDGLSPKLALELELPLKKRVILSFPRARRTGPPCDGRGSSRRRCSPRGG